MKKRIIAIEIIVMLLLSCLTITSAIGEGSIVIASSGNTLYVGGSGPSNYTTIQDAIDAINDSSDIDTIFVYNGTYNENIVVNKSISLIGEDRNTTIIDGGSSDDVIYVSAAWVNISNFTIRNSGHIYSDAGLDIHSNHNTITDNTISSNNAHAINLHSSSNNIITGNTIDSNDYHGILLYYSSNNTITRNTILNNNDGIRLGYSSNNNIISGNTILNNGNGILLYYSSNNTITGNTISSNNFHGIYLLSSSSNNTIAGNTISDTGNVGIWLEFSRNNTITDNTISDSGYVFLHTSNSNTIVGNNFFNNGVLVIDSYHNTVVSNTVNNKPLVYLEDKSDDIVTDAGQVILVNCNNITVENLNLSKASIGIELFKTDNSKIRNNDCSNNHNGIYLYSSGNTIGSNDHAGLQLYSSGNNTITDNTISDNGFGISVFEEFGIHGNNNIIYHNNFINNTQNAYDNCNNYWDNGYPSGGNYWDDYAGTDENEDGIGDTPYNISGGDNKDYYPLMEPYDSGEPNLLVGIKGGIKRQIDVTILNQGTADATNVEYNISVEGGMLGLISEYKEGIIPEFKAGAKYIDTIEVFGLGFIDINVTVNGVSREHYGFVIGKFVIMSDYDET